MLADMNTKEMAKGLEQMELTPHAVLAASLEMLRELLEARQTVRDGSKADRRALHDTMCDALDLYYRGKEALEKL